MRRPHAPRTLTDAGLRAHLKTCEDRVVDFTFATPWPLLADSWRADADEAKRLIEQRERNDHSPDA